MGCLGSPSFLHATLYPSPQQVISQSQPQSQFLNAEERRRPSSSLTTHQSSPSSMCTAKGIDRLQVWPQPALLSHHYCFLPCPPLLTPTLPPVCLYGGQRLRRPTVTSVKWAEETYKHQHEMSPAWGYLATEHAWGQRLCSGSHKEWGCQPAEGSRQMAYRFQKEGRACSLQTPEFPPRVSLSAEAEGGWM